MEGTGTDEVLKEKKEKKYEKFIAIGIIITVIILGCWFLINEKVIKPNKFVRCGEQPTDEERYLCCVKNGSLGAAGMDSCYHIYRLHLNETYGK